MNELDFLILGIGFIFGSYFYRYLAVKDNKIRKRIFLKSNDINEVKKLIEEFL